MSNESLKIRVGHSPDPDDAFMFYALTTGALETPGRIYEHVLVDIDTLNEEAKKGTYEVSAVSINSYPEVSHSYDLMNCGASMGEGYGPILISKSEMSVEQAKDAFVGQDGSFSTRDSSEPVYRW